jgi:hypothetical protein
MKGQQTTKRIMMALGLLLVSLLALVLPIQAAPTPEETSLSSPWFPETLSAGMQHTCALRTGGTLACWGNNLYGQATPPAGTFSQVSAGYWHTCGLRADGTLACWGFLGGEATPRAAPARSAGLMHLWAAPTTPACWGRTMTVGDPERHLHPGQRRQCTPARCAPTPLAC